jgi:hypothetical protein
VEKLTDQRKKKEVELHDYLKLTVKDLWLRDLDDLDHAWEQLLENDDLLSRSETHLKKKAGKSKLTKTDRKRASDAADGEYLDRKPKKPKPNASPKQSRVSSLSAKTTDVKGTKSMHTAAFTSVNKLGGLPSSKSALLTKVKPMSIDDDDEFDLLIRDIRPDPKPTTIDLVSPQTAVKPKKTIAIPGLKKPSRLAIQKRAAPKPKVVKKKVESDDDASFSFMEEKSATTERRPTRVAASKAKAIVLTSDDEMDEDDFEEEDDD